jgi:hypothetical protein
MRKRLEVKKFRPCNFDHFDRPRVRKSVHDVWRRRGEFELEFVGGVLSAGHREVVLFDRNDLSIEPIGRASSEHQT